MLVEDLEGGDDGVDGEPFDELLESGLLPGGNGQQDRVGAEGQHHGVAEEVEEPAEHLGRLDALLGGLVEEAEGRGGVVIGQGLEHRQDPLVAGRPEQSLHDLDGEVRAARGQQSIEQRFGVP